jgi:hypothetical protein
MSQLDRMLKGASQTTYTVPNNPRPRRRSGRIEIHFAAVHESACGTFRTSLLELMMSVHWVEADIAVASVEI